MRGQIPLDFWKVKSVSLAGSRGRAGTRAPPRSQILSFWHTKFSKRNHLGTTIRPPTRSTPFYGKSWIRHWVSLRLISPKFQFMKKKKKKTFRVYFESVSGVPCFYGWLGTQYFSRKICPDLADLPNGIPQIIFIWRIINPINEFKKSINQKYSLR